MKRVILIASILIIATVCAESHAKRAYEELPLGAVKADGWLLEMLQRQKIGHTANLDETYPEVCGSRNGWLGGDGDQWERGPYWIDGLLPLAYILDDNDLKEKTQKWVEWTLASQTDDGQFGPRTDYPREKGIQRSKSLDWWPRMVMLKVLQQYYSATGDERVIVFLDKYFRYQLRELSASPLNRWTNWAPFRQGDNMLVAMWLYRQTGEPYLLDLCRLLHAQGFDFVSLFEGEDLSRPGAIHCVNLAQGLKEPVVYYEVTGDSSLLRTTEAGLEKIRRYNGFPSGMFGGDETLHGNDPTQGSELCSAVELMYSYEEMLKITGDPAYADRLEQVAFNALPAQISDDFTLHQYFQQSNQIHVCLGGHDFDVYNRGTSLVYGFLTGYPCCLCNLGQGWPKFTRNLWLATSDGGYAALAYAPCHVDIPLEKGGLMRITETTDYPFNDVVRFEITMPRKTSRRMPLQFRIPQWCQGASIRVNGTDAGEPCTGGICTIEREWRNADVVELTLPMHIELSRWASNSVAVQRGPLVYSLKVDGIWEQKTLDPSLGNGPSCWELTALSDWNYAFALDAIANPGKWFRIEKADHICPYPWSPDAAPLRIKVEMTKIPTWQEYNGHAGLLPYSQVPSGLKYNLNSSSSAHRSDGSLTEVTLIPYGCTDLRITQFPAVRVK